MADVLIVETIERIRDALKKSDAFKLHFYNDAYRSGPALASVYDDHASKKNVRDMMIDDYRKEYGYPKDVLCAVDGRDYNGATANAIARSVENTMRGKTSAEEAHARGNKFRNFKFSKSGDDTITQLMDNGELFVINVANNKVKSHYVAGPVALARIKKVFNEKEANSPSISEHADVIRSGIDMLVKRMEPLKRIHVPSSIRNDHCGHAIGSEYENIDWDKVNEKHYGFIKERLIEAGFFSSAVNGGNEPTKPNVVEAIAELMADQNRVRNFR